MQILWKKIKPATTWLKFGAEEYGQTIAFAAVSAWILVYMWPVFRPEYHFEGWDTMGHYYLFLQMREYLLSGAFRGYNPDLFGGYPEFYLYAPLPYLLPALLQIGTFGLLSTTFVFKLFIVLLPVGLVAVIQYVAQKHLDKTAAVFAVILSIFYLSPGNDFFMIGFGMQSVVEAGLIGNMLGMIFLLLYLSSLLTADDQISRRSVFLPAILLTLTILSHLLTGVFALFATAIFVLAKRAKHSVYRIIAILAVSFVFGAVWFIPFLQLLPFSSGAAIGQNGFDPLSVLFPYFFEGIGEAWSTGHLTLLFSSGSLFAAGILAAVYLRKSLAIWWWWYAAGIVLLPRDLLAETLPFPFHYFRFIAQIFSIHLLLTAAGLSALVRASSVKWRSVTATVIGICILVLIQTEAAANLYLSSPFIAIRGAIYPERTNADEVIQQLGTGSQLVLSEQTMDLQRRLGSVHYFPFVLTMTTAHRSMTGLLAESSLSHAFISPAWSAVTNSLSWSEPLQFGLRRDQDDAKLEKSHEILSMYPIDNFIVTSTPALRTMRAWEEKGYVRQSNSSGRFTVYDNLQTLPLVSKADRLPFLYVQKSGLPFMAFLAHLYTHGQIIPGQFAQYSGSMSAIPDSHRQYFAGVVLSQGKTDRLRLSEAQQYFAFRPYLVVIDGTVDQAVLEYVTQHHDLKLVMLSTIDHAMSPEWWLDIGGSVPDENEPVAYTSFENGIRFVATGAVVVRLNYFPTLKINSRRDYYWLSPSHIYTIGESDNVVQW